MNFHREHYKIAKVGKTRKLPTIRPSAPENAHKVPAKDLAALLSTVVAQYVAAIDNNAPLLQAKLK